MLGCDIISSAGAHVPVGEPLVFLMHTRVNADTEKAGIRLEIFYEVLSIAGTVFADQPIDGIKGELFDLKLALDTSNLAPGRYRAAALFYEVDSQGNQVCIDRVEPAITFEIIQNNTRELVWLHQCWGHIRMNDMRLEKESLKKVTEHRTAEHADPCD